MTTKVVKGSIWTLAGQVAPLVVSIVATPFVIRLLGAEGYGVFILIGLIPTYLGFADVGMSMASTRFGSEAFGEGDREKEARVIRTAAMIAMSVVIPAALLIMIFAPHLITLFNVPDAFRGEALLALRLASITFVINFLCMIFNSPQLARLRMDLNTMINAGSRILGIIAIPIVLYLGFGIVGAVSVLLAASVLNLFGHLTVSRRLLPELLGLSIDRAMVPRLLKFGGALVVGGIAGIALINGEKGILASAVSATALAYYTVAFTLANMMTLFSGSMVQSLIPAFSQLQGEAKRAQLDSIYSRGLRFSMLWSLPILVFLALIAKPFFTIWAGPDFGRESAWPFYLLLAGLFFNIFALLPHSAILAAGRTDILAKLYWIELGPHLVIVWLLASRYGPSGAAAAWSIRVIVDAAIHFYLAKRVAGVAPPRQGMRGFVAGVVLMTMPVAAMMYIGETTIWIAAWAAAAFAVYVFIAVRYILGKDEIAWATAIIRHRLAR